MTIVGVQIIGALFALFMIYLVYLRIKRGEFTVKESLFWIVCWVAFLLISIFPTSLDMLSWDVLHLSRTMDFIIVLGFLFLIGVVFYMYTLIRQSQKQIDAIVRNIALKEAKRKQHEKKGEH